MIAPLGLVLAMLSLPAAAGHGLLTLQGDPFDPGAETVQVDPTALNVMDDIRTMPVHVSRGHVRTGYDGTAYRSYRAITRVRCTPKDARFQQLELFEGPLWTGTSRTIAYPEGRMPPMQFKDMSPNPTERILTAACTLHAVKSKASRRG